ncbi:heme-degrading domain-containing protein [Aestuariivirga litoralis]|uniref:heme-degrading domain-containing protein n=1 Tax=Aestuariivirga litoralis TaxID=2650924 RepID=UPI0018C6D67D|nr:heme-degrading domain-containing protein [Aestuariivirga litoralis]MBG1231379.1 heme-degrading domain-containing protein [Aestuariivirga litoralis]
MSLTDDIVKIEEQEKALRFASFNEADAWALGQQMREAAAKQKLPLVIDIRIADRQLFFAALPGTTADNSEWVRRKVNSVQRFQKSSYRINREVEKDGRPFAQARALDILDYAYHGGGFPIHVEGAGVIGAITVSGVPQRNDHGFVVEQLCLYLKKDHASLVLGPGAAD